MVTLAVPGAGIRAVSMVTCACVLLRIWVLSVVPLMTTTEEARMSLPVRVRTNPDCTSAKVMLVAESELRTGAGRALRQRGLSALQPCKISTARSSAQNGRMEVLIDFIGHRTPRDGGCWGTEVTFVGAFATTCLGG